MFADLLTNLFRNIILYGIIYNLSLFSSSLFCSVSDQAQFVYELSPKTTRMLKLAHLQTS